MVITGRIKSILLLLLIPASALAQTTSDSTGISIGNPVYSQYLQNPLVINPAYAGSRGALCGFLWYRSQWMGIEGAPSMQSLSLHTPLKNDKIGLGMTAQFMQYGFTRQTSVYAMYSYNIRTMGGRLAFGIRGGADVTNTLFPSDRFLNDQGNSDPVFAQGDYRYVLPNTGAGVYFYNDKYFAGISVPNFLSYTRTGSGAVQAVHSFRNYDFLISAGALYPVSAQVKFKPSFMADLAPGAGKKIQRLDLNANLIFSNLLWLGTSWRTSEQIVAGIAQIQLNQQIMLGLSYDYPVGRMNSFSKGSTEIILRYDFATRVSAANPKFF